MRFSPLRRLFAKNRSMSVMGMFQQVPEPSIDLPEPSEFLSQCGVRILQG